MVVASKGATGNSVKLHRQYKMNSFTSIPSREKINRAGETTHAALSRNSRPLSPTPPLHSNQTMQRLLKQGVLQTKLTINQPGDALEREADRVAESVMRMPDPAATREPMATSGAAGRLQRCSCGKSTSTDTQCEECKSKAMQLQRSSAIASEAAATGTMTAPPIVHDVLNSPSSPLDAGTRRFMEPRFGFDFGRVRVHTSAKAAESARVVGALAYTVGQNVVFGSGQHTPHTAAGQRLIAHELTHVMQQSRMTNGEIHRLTTPWLQRFTGCNASQDRSIERARTHAITKVDAAIAAVAAIQAGTPTATQRRAFARHFGTLSAADMTTVHTRFDNIKTRLSAVANFRCDTSATYSHCGAPDSWCAGTDCPDMTAVSHLCPAFFSADRGGCDEPSEAEDLIHESARAAGCCPPDISRGASGYPPGSPGVLTNVFSYTGLTHSL